MTFYEDLKSSGAIIESHETDLLTPDTPVARALLKKHKLRFEEFVDNIAQSRWLDIPFAFEPGWGLNVADVSRERDL